MTTINENFASTHTDWENAEYTSAVWTPQGEAWSLVNTYDDPYDGVEPLAKLGRTALLEMFGWASSMETGERKRCRVLFSVNENGTPTVSAQFSGDSNLIQDDSIEGAFMDYYYAVCSFMASNK